MTPLFLHNSVLHFLIFKCLQYCCVMKKKSPINDKFELILLSCGEVDNVLEHILLDLQTDASNRYLDSVEITLISVVVDYWCWYNHPLFAPMKSIEATCSYMKEIQRCWFFVMKYFCIDKKVLSCVPNTLLAINR